MDNYILTLTQVKTKLLNYTYKCPLHATIPDAYEENNRAIMAQNQSAPKIPFFFLCYLCMCNECGLAG